MDFVGDPPMLGGGAGGGGGARSKPPRGLLPTSSWRFDGSPNLLSQALVLPFGPTWHEFVACRLQNLVAAPTAAERQAKRGAGGIYGWWQWWRRHLRQHPALQTLWPCRLWPCLQHGVRRFSWRSPLQNVGAKERPRGVPRFLFEQPELTPQRRSGVFLKAGPTSSAQCRAAMQRALPLHPERQLQTPSRV